MRITDSLWKSGFIAPVVVVAATTFLVDGASLAAEGIGGAETVVNEVKGSLAPDKVVAVLQGDEVYRDEGVRTAPDSSAKLVLRDNTVVTVGASTYVKLDRFVYAGEGQRGAIALNLVKGALVFATGNAEKHSYQITTPTAALGVRGTIFRVEATATLSRVVLVEGAVHVCMRSPVNRRCVDLDHPGEEASVTTTQVAVTTSPASPAAPATTTGHSGGGHGGGGGAASGASGGASGGASCGAAGGAAGSGASGG